MAIVQVPITKGKGFVEIDTDNIPQSVYEEALLQGLKTLANRGASKITKAAYTTEAEMHQAAMEKAQEQVKLINEGKIKFSGKAKSTKASGAVMTEARRLARNLIKDELKAAKIKISHVDAKEITAAANKLLEGETGKALIARAEANLKERSDVTVSSDLVKSIAINPKKVAAAEARKAAKKAEKGEPLSATQAGKPATRAKPKGNAPQASA